MVSAGGAADHCGSHAARGDPEDPPASEARGGPPPDCSGASPPRSLRLVLRLTAPGGSRTRSRQPSAGPALRFPLCCWGGMAILRPAHPLSASRGCPYAAPLILAACCTPARVSPVSRTCSLSHRMHPSQPLPLRSASSVASALYQVSSAASALFSSSSLSAVSVSSSSLSASSSASARLNQCSRNSASGARLPPLGAGGRLGGQVARHRVGAHGWRTRLVEKAV